MGVLNLKCDKCGQETEKVVLSFGKPEKLEPVDSNLIAINEAPPMPGKILCKECSEKSEITVDGIIGALKGFKVYAFKGEYFYYHGGREQRETGLSVEEVVKYFSNDLSIIVVDPENGKMYRGGKPLIPKIAKAKGQKTIYFKGVKNGR